MNLFKIIALVALTSACAPTYISLSGTIPPEIQQNIAPAISMSVNLNIIHQQSQQLMFIQVAPLWDIEIDISSPMENAFIELIENKFSDISKKSATTIQITIHEIKYSVSRRKANPTALHFNARITVDINSPGGSFSRHFRHKATTAIIGSNVAFFNNVGITTQAMVLKFVIDLDKFIQSAKI